MKFFTTLALAAGAAIGTGIVLDKVTDGYVKEALTDKIHGIDDLGEPGLEYEDNLGPDNGFDLLTDDNGGKHVIMPLEDAINIYECIEDAVGKIDPEDTSDYKCFGDKAISFERLYDCIASELNDIEDNLDDLENEALDSLDENHATEEALEVTGVNPDEDENE